MKKKLLSKIQVELIVFFMFFCCVNLSYSNSFCPQEPQNEPILTTVEKMPEYPGGETAMKNFIAANLKYPNDAKEEDIAGKVFASFIVEKDGKISNIKIMKSLTKSCDEEVIRVIKLMPKWKPGTQKGSPVRVAFVLPIAFQLK